MIKIEYVDYADDIDVYDITVPKTECFYANNILVHNCSEITLHADELHTYACVLSSMNGSKYDEWKNTDAVYVSTIFLDCVNEDLIVRGSQIDYLDAVVRSAKKSRALGLGLLGFHTYLQEHMVPFESVEAIEINEEMFKHLNHEAIRASRDMAIWFGEPEWCEGYGMRNTHTTAVAPNMCVSGNTSFKLKDDSNITMKDFIKLGGINYDDFTTIQVNIGGNVHKYQYNDIVEINRDGVELTIKAYQILQGDIII